MVAVSAADRTSTDPSHAVFVRGEGRLRAPPTTRWMWPPTGVLAVLYTVTMQQAVTGHRTRSQHPKNHLDPRPRVVASLGVGKPRRGNLRTVMKGPASGI